jgi:hypothetical protein
MSNSLFDPKMYKHVKSDKHSTTLKHKRGHTITLAHNVLSPKMRTALEALSKIPQENATEGQAQESQDQHQYGKVIMKADGGDVEQKTVLGMPVYGTGVHKDAPPQREGTQPGQNDEEWPLPSQTPVGKAIAEKKGMAKGGKVESNDHLASGKDGKSTQGLDVRHKDMKMAKEEAKGRAAMERTVKPKLAEGGGVNAPGGPVDANFAYEHGMPCRNPACKSNGRPHPNCRCYSFADGGEVKHVCGVNLGHYDDCEYYVPKRMAGGGDVDVGMDSGITPWSKRQQPQEEAKPAEPTLEELQHAMERQQQPQDAQPDAQMTTPSPMLQPGMPGADEAQAQPYDNSTAPAIDENAPTPAGAEEAPQLGSGTQPHAIDHGNDHYGQPDRAPSQEAPAPAQDVVPQQRPVGKQEIAQHLMDEDKAWVNDLNNGHITPKTYNDLMYHNKDGTEKSTLGKIGSIFGLLLSGAGSGLAHQQNAAIQMMDNVIKNDLEAQKTSKSNAQNYLRINQQRLLNDANIKSVLAGADYTDAQKKAVVQGINAKAMTMSLMQMNQAALHAQLDMLKKLPKDSPQYQQAAQVAMMLAGKVNESNAQAAVIGATQLEGLGNMAGFNNGQANPEAKFQDQVNMLEHSNDPADQRTAAMLRETHFPGLPGKASRPLGGQDREKIESGIEFDQKLNRFIDWTKNHSGSLNPSTVKEGTALAAELQGAYRQATHGGVYKEGEQNFISKLIDSDPTKFFNSVRVLPSLNALAKEHNSRMQQTVRSLGFPRYERPNIPNEGRQGQSQE